MELETLKERFRLWLRRYLRDSAHEIAVKATVAVVLASMAQWHFDWIGKSRTVIGEWNTIVQKER